MSAVRRKAPRGLVRHRHRLVRMALMAAGWTLLLIGVIGGLLPVIQGWPFGVLGATILYVESRTVQRAVRRWRQKHPRFERTWLKARRWLRERRKAGKGRRGDARPSSSLDHS